MINAETRIQRKLDHEFHGKVKVHVTEECIRVEGELQDWNDIVKACQMCVIKKSRLHVVNDIHFTGASIPEMRKPEEESTELEGAEPDVLIIGGGISGASIARELMKYKVSVLLVDKESDLAMQASGRNDGEVHPGVDLGNGSLKHHYVLIGNKMYDRVCSELSVPFRRCGQYVGFTQKLLLPVIWAYAMEKKYVCGVKDTEVIGKKKLQEREPELNPEFAFALYNPSAGCVCPYGLTIAYAENAVQNGAEVSLNTAVLSMEVRDGKIFSVKTNRGTVYPKVVINAAGVFAEDIAAMAEDRFYSIHPRRGTDSIMDKKAGHLVHSISSIKKLSGNKSHTKGGGILHTVDDNLLVGPNAVETYEKENYATDAKSIDEVMNKQKQTAPGLGKQDIITYFTGVRAATFEEDFVIEKGRKTKNLVHCAGIQSPGITTAPAVAVDVAKMAVEELSSERKIESNPSFNPNRKGIPVLRNMPAEERNAMIEKDPDYGVIVCRCEEISKGEILDALNSIIPVHTIDAVKKRVRPGMGRCQGGFCMPLVAEIISELDHVPLNQVKKGNGNSVLTYGETKMNVQSENGGKNHEAV